MYSLKLLTAIQIVSAQQEESEVPITITEECEIDNCLACNAELPEFCEVCSFGFRLDATNEACEEDICSDPNCDDCSISGPDVCFVCRDGFKLDQIKDICTDCSAAGDYWSQNE